MILSLLVKENSIIFMNIKDWLGMMEMEMEMQLSTTKPGGSGALNISFSTCTPHDKALP